MDYSVRYEENYLQMQKIALKMYDQFVLNKSNMNKKEMETQLLNYTRDIISANLTKDNINNGRINIESMPSKAPKRVTGSMRFGEYPKKKKNSTLNLNTDKLIRALSSPDDKVRFTCLTRYFETIQHEYRHYKQRRAIILGDDKVGYSFSEKYIMSREAASRGVKDEFFYKLKNNYKNYYMEADARRAGKTEALMISRPIYDKAIADIKSGKLRSLTTKDIDNDCFDRAISRETNDIVMSNKMSFFKATGDRNKITSRAADLSIATNKDILNIYPLLNIEYNKDGTKKTLEGICIKENELRDYAVENTSESKELNDLFDMIYTDFLVRKYKPDELKEITRRIGKDNMSTLLSRCQRYNEENRQSQIDDLNKARIDSEEVILENRNTYSSLYYKKMNELNDSIDKNYRILNKKIYNRENEINLVNNEYKTGKLKRKSLKKEEKENKKFNKVISVIKKPAMMWYKISETMDLDKNKGKDKVVNPADYRIDKFSGIDYDYDEDIDLDEKRKSLRELKEIRLEKRSILHETNDCIRESEKYIKSRENRDIRNRE